MVNIVRHSIVKHHLETHEKMMISKTKAFPLRYHAYNLRLIRWFLLNSVAHIEQMHSAYYVFILQQHD